jgi:hypothetical protein
MVTLVYINAFGLNRVISSCLTLHFLDLKLKIRAEMHTFKDSNTVPAVQGVTVGTEEYF